MKISEKKIINAIIFFASKSPDKKIDRLKLMKLLWLSDRAHLNKYGRTILDDKYYAMKCGPILSEAKEVSEHNVNGIFEVNGYIIKAQKNPDLDFFSKSDLEIMNIIWLNYGDVSPSKLVLYSHKFPEWKRYKKNLESGSIKRIKMIMEDFFETPNDDKFVSLIQLPKENIEHSRNEYRNSNALLAWLHS